MAYCSIAVFNGFYQDTDSSSNKNEHITFQCGHSPVQWLTFQLCVLMIGSFFQNSFEIPREQGNGHGDIELGENAANLVDTGLENFFKKVP